MTKKGDVRIEYVALDGLAKAPRNPKTHDLEMLGDSIDRFGFVQPLLVDERSGRLVAGHGRLETLVRARAAGQPRRFKRTHHMVDYSRSRALKLIRKEGVSPGPS